MMNLLLFFSLINLVFLSPLSAQVQNTTIDVTNYGFELAVSDNLPANRQINTPGIVRMDSQNTRSGSSSLQIIHSTSQKTTIISDPLNLKIGHLYRLSAWIKTENVVTNPVDRYPTSIAACITMASFPFTNQSPSLGATNDWQKIEVRFIADAFMLRKYEKEYLTEMRGIADGANKAGVKLFDQDLIDVVTMNSAIDIEWARYAMPRTANLLSGQNFMKSEDELNIPEKLHKCSSFLANKSSTTDGRIVFGQIFMWGGYTGPHWNIICDIIPAPIFISMKKVS